MSATSRTMKQIIAWPGSWLFEPMMEYLPSGRGVFPRGGVVSTASRHVRMWRGPGTVGRRGGACDARPAAGETSGAFFVADRRLCRGSFQPGVGYNPWRPYGDPAGRST